MKYKKRSKNNKVDGMKGGDLLADVPRVGPDDAVQARPLEVKVYGNNFDKALRAFRTLVQKERVLSSYKEKQSYEKPSDKRRRKVNESKRKQFELCSKGECRHADHAKNKKDRKLKKNSSE